MNLMLTDPDVLADYVNDFYGPEWSLSTPTERELAEMEECKQSNSSLLKRFTHKRSILFLRTSNVLTQDMPARNIQSQGACRTSGVGSVEMMDNNPEDAWKVLSQADPRAFQQKLLVQDL